MKSMKIKSIAMAGVLSLSMLAGMPVMAAEEGSTGGTITHPSIPVTKTITYAEGVTLPENDVVRIHFDQLENGPEEPEKVDVSIDDMTIHTTNSDFISGVAKLVGSVKGDPFTKNGVYHYKVTETSPAAGGDWQVGSEEYTLNVYVHNGSDGETVKEFTLSKNGDTEKKDTAAFTNTYTATTELTIGKTVEDNSSIEDPNKEYTFEVVLENVEPNKISDNSKFAWSVNGEQKGTITGNSDEVTLKNGETATISNLPAGTKVTVTEKTTGNFTTKNTVTAYKKDAEPNNGASTDPFILQNNGDNAVVFTNTYKKITFTGVVTNIAPYITMVVVAGAAIAVYVVLKKRLAR